MPDLGSELENAAETITGIHRYRTRLMFTVGSRWVSTSTTELAGMDALDISHALTGDEFLDGIEDLNHGDKLYFTGYLTTSIQKFADETVAIAAIDHYLSMFNENCPSTMAGVGFVDDLMRVMSDPKHRKFAWFKDLVEAVIYTPNTVLGMYERGIHDDIADFLHLFDTKDNPTLYMHPYQLADEVGKIEVEDKEDCLLTDEPFSTFTTVAAEHILHRRIVRVLHTAVSVLLLLAREELINGKPLDALVSSNAEILRRNMIRCYFLDKALSI